MNTLSKKLKLETASKGIAEAGPILKWAGGKSQLLPVLSLNYPEALKTGKIKTYIEPFVGGGAVFFDVANRYTFEHAYLFDTNPDLVILYNALKQDPDWLIEEIAKLEEEYLIQTAEQQERLFYERRSEYNSDNGIKLKAETHTPFNCRRAALTIFLNRTCFNGLFRVNSKGHFNVPYGKHRNPTILFKDKLLAVSECLQKATIQLGDFSEIKSYITPNTFIYYDPPYRPISVTSHFKAYSKEAFDDDEQRRLATFFKKQSKEDVYQLLSNSDPSNHIVDDFFDVLYKGFKITKVDARRMINAKGSGRGTIKELLIKNYD